MPASRNGASRTSRIVRFVLRWTIVAIVVLAVLEAMCHVVLLSNDSLPVDFAPDPHMAYRMVPGRGVSSLGVTFEINALGLRGPEVVKPKPPGVFRILVLGDSVTLGYGVPEEASYPRVLEQLARGGRVEVINAGTSGHHTIDQVGFLEHYGLALEPDLVVTGFTYSDLEPPLKLVIRDGVGYDATENVAFIPPWVKKTLRHSRLYLAIGRARWAMANRTPDAASDPKARDEIFLAKWPEQQGPVNRLVAVCDEHRLPLVIAYLPAQAEVARGVEYPALIERLAALGRPNVHFVNTVPRFAAENSPGSLFLPFDPVHPNSRGHRVMARTLADDAFLAKALPAGATFAPP